MALDHHDQRGEEALETAPKERRLALALGNAICARPDYSSGQVLLKTAVSLAQS
jgi:hypothetical protein